MESSPKLKKLISQINNHAEIFVFGGWCRDKIHIHKHGAVIASSDIDLIIDGVIPVSVLNEAIRNHFGGFRLNLESTSQFVDFWPLNQTYAFREGFFAPSINNLLRSTVFDINSILFDIQNDRIINGLALDAIARRNISFNCIKYLDAFAELQAFRALYLANKLNYSLGEDVLHFVERTIKKKTFEDFANIVQTYRAHIPREKIHKLYANFPNLTSLDNK
ncbi:hypothetical protein ACFLVW_04130 [Chloroflexota bacterium]